MTNKFANIQTTEPSSKSCFPTPTKVILVMLLFCSGVVRLEKPQKTVGILTLTAKSLTNKIQAKYEQQFSKLSSNFTQIIESASFIAETYFDWLNHVDLKPVPLDIHMEDNLLMAEIEKFDALLLTGGSQQFYVKTNSTHRNLEEVDPVQQMSDLVSGKIPDEYLKKVEKIIKRVKLINDEKRRFPLWATCLGFEATLITEAHYTLVRHVVDNELKGPLPINIYNPMAKSLAFFSQTEKDYFNVRNLFYFNHKFGFKLDEFLYNEHLKGKVGAVATITKDRKDILVWFEYKNYPFLGSQFHPEKFEENSDSSDDQEVLYQKNINHKMALLFKSMINENEDFVPEVSDVSDFETESKDSHFDLYNIGLYNHINLYIRPHDLQK
jgi:hypothetical protein